MSLRMKLCRTTSFVNPLNQMKFELPQQIVGEGNSQGQVSFDLSTDANQ